MDAPPAISSQEKRSYSSSSTKTLTSPDPLARAQLRISLLPLLVGWLNAKPPSVVLTVTP